MASIAQLSSSDREFAGLVSRAAFCNPFSETFSQLHAQIAQCAPDAPFRELRSRSVARISEWLQKRKKAGAEDLRRYGGEERILVATAHLFEVYHRSVDAFDDLILKQIEEADRSSAVRFAPEVLPVLAGSGFTHAEALRYFGIFYQMRRAFFFIHRELLGRSPCMQQLRHHLWNSIFTHDIRWYDRHLWNRMEDFSTLLLGETGTGKGTAAAAIGRSGFIPFDEKRKCFAESFTHSFLSINLSQYPEALIESELFGHKKGAFTGAIEVHEGVFARASQHGSIFLDEIGEVSVPVQIKLLQVLQERTFSPVGSHEKLRFQGRVIAATNKPPSELRGRGSFRDDFFYRLCSDVITVPPLRQRLREEPSELDDLLLHILNRMGSEAASELLPMVREILIESVGKDYAWPGNVREMEQAVRRILLTRKYEGDHKTVAPDLRSRLVAGIESGSLDADALLSGYCRLLYEHHANFEEVARRTNLDRRTVKAYIEKGK